MMCNATLYHDNHNSTMNSLLVPSWLVTNNPMSYDVINIDDKKNKFQEKMV